MLYPLIFPLQLTAAFVVGTCVVLGVVLALKRVNAVKGVVAVIATLVLAPIPVLLATAWVVDMFRYGTFTYATASEITDGHVKLPPSASNITVVKYASGHQARFQVAEQELVAWLSTIPRPQGSAPKYGPEDFSARFAEYGWLPPADIRFLEGPRAANGGGFNVWFSPSAATAWLDAGYW